MQIHDGLTLDASGLSFTRDGYLVGDAKIARAGNVQTYRGSEIGLTGDEAGQLFGVYRDPEMVFDTDAMLSLAGRPVTRGHPPEGVSAETWRDLAVGQVGGVIRKDGEHVVAPMAIMDAAAAREVMAGARSLSAGYTCQIVADEGVSDDGTPYQFRQVGPLRFNHVAYLPDNNPRAGNTRIGDQAGLAPITMSDKKEDIMSDALQTVVLGDKAIQVSAKDQAVIDAYKAEMQKTLADAKTAQDAAVAAKDAEIDALKAKLNDAEGKVLTADAISKLVSDRAALEGKAKAIAADVKPEGLTDADLRKAVVAAKIGDEAIKDKPQAYIDARFDILAEDAAKTTDPVADALKSGIKDAAPTDITKVYEARDAALSQAWMQPKKEA